MNAKQHRKFFEEQSKQFYTAARDAYDNTDDGDTEKMMLRGEIDILAGIYNHDRALFDRGLTKFKEGAMVMFEEYENNPIDTLTVKHVELDESPFELQIEAGGPPKELVSFHGTCGKMKGEEAVFTLGEAIKQKRNMYERIQGRLGKKWWKK